MSPNDDFRQQLGEFKALIELIGDEINGSIEREENGRVIEGYQCTHGQHAYFISGNPDEMYFTIQYPFDIRGSLVSIIDDDTAELLVPDASEVELPEGAENLPPDIQEQLEDRQLHRRAAEIVLENQPDEIMEQYEFELVRLLTATDCGYELRRTQNNVIAGYDVTQKIYPYRDGFHIGRLDQAVQAVVSVGNQGLMFTKTALDLEEMAEPAQDIPAEQRRYVQ